MSYLKACPECGDRNWNDLGCMSCGLEFFPPSEAYWAASTLTLSERVAQLYEEPEPDPEPAPRRTRPGPSIKAIETSYAGCRFRSRLEAWWAVFFDTLRIRWEYEREGYECEPRCGLSGSKPFWYLPDFWLPDLKLHAEVKGTLDEQETLRLLDAAAYLSSPGGGCGGGNDMLVLGPVPQPPERYGVQFVPARLHMHKGALYDVPWTGQANGACLFPENDRSMREPITWDDSPGLAEEWSVPGTLGRFLLGATYLPRAYQNPPFTPGWKHGEAAFTDAFAAARSARFEHGESGAPATRAAQPRANPAKRQFGGPDQWRSV